jgi:hypothetical protein
VERIEQQLVGAEDSSTRDVANAAYEQVVNTILDTLQQMAKLDRTDMTGTGDDKGQLNYFIIMIGEWSFKNASPIQAEESCLQKTCTPLLAILLNSICRFSTHTWRGCRSFTTTTWTHT